MTIKELYNKEISYWKKKNIELFGVTCIHEEDRIENIQLQLINDCNQYWNCETPCELAKKINDGTLDHHKEYRIPNSYCLKLNILNMCIDVYSIYNYNGKEKNYKICAIPTPCDDLSWIINKTHYVPRITAKRDDNHFLYKKDGIIYGEGWNYDCDKNIFSCILNKNKFDATIEEIFNYHLSVRSRFFLSAYVDDLNIRTFTNALQKIPHIETNSIFNYKFSRLGYFEDLIFNSKKKARPCTGVLLGINQMIVSKKKKNSNNQDSVGCIVRSESKIFSLENFRTVVNVFEGEYKPAFTYTDTIGFFDCFKTVTSSEAGRQRLLLDNVVCKDGMLWVQKDKQEINMFKLMNNPQEERLSCLSKAPFGNNDKPKRIMMNAKLTSQSVPLKDEIDNLTHRIYARVGFGDLEGYTYADSIVISESFAERLRTYDSDILYLSQKSKEFAIIQEHHVFNKPFTLEELRLIYPKKIDSILDSMENIQIDRVELYGSQARVFLTWEIPFRIGDKITNLHGAKGTAGLILPDDKMPCLKKQVGNMMPGALEVVISGFSTMRRGSLGQIFEAWALASGIKEENFIYDAIEKYSEQMKKYADNSIVEYNGEKIIMPIGINHIMRVHHHASTHISLASHENNISKSLKLGEMEKLNLISLDDTDILKELAIRSLHKYKHSDKLIKEMEETRELPKVGRVNLRFNQFLKTLGYIMYEPTLNSELQELEDSIITPMDKLDFNDLIFVSNKIHVGE